MQRYLNQLLGDLDVATRHAPDASSYRYVSSFPDDEDEYDLGPTFTREVRLCELFDLAPEAFPPVERLTKKQVAAMLTAFETLWKAYRIAFDAPYGLTARPRYTCMVELMTEDTVPYHYDFGARLNFCARRSEGHCPFGTEGSCHCAEIEAAAAEIASWEPPTDDVFDFDAPPNPLAELNDWLGGDRPRYRCDWENEDRERWQKFVENKDEQAWLFFYHPARRQEEPEALNAEDFEDFDWPGGQEDEFDLPF